MLIEPLHDGRIVFDLEGVESHIDTFLANVQSEFKTDKMTAYATTTFTRKWVQSTDFVNTHGTLLDLFDLFKMLFNRKITQKDGYFYAGQILND